MVMGFPDEDNPFLPEMGSLCVLLPDEWHLRFGPQISLLEYLDGPLYHYFIGQMCVERGQPWPQGERAHGSIAVAEYYQEFFRTTDKLSTLRILDVVRQGRYKGHWDCPCGGGEIIRKCHGDAMRLVQSRLPRERLKKSICAILGEVVKDARRDRTCVETATAKWILQLCNAVCE